VWAYGQRRRDFIIRLRIILTSNISAFSSSTSHNNSNFHAEQMGAFITDWTCKERNEKDWRFLLMEFGSTDGWPGVGGMHALILCAALICG
jgi:hypothetical protein